MTAADRARFAAAIGVLAETTRQAMSQLLVEAYFKALADLTIEQVEQGVMGVLRTHKFATLPLPAEIRESAVGSTDDAAALAWAALQKAFRDVGRYRSPRAALGAAGYAAMQATFGDWSAACDMETGGAAAASARKAFVAAYAALERRTAQDALLRLGDGERAAQGRLGPSVADVAGLVKVMR